MFNNLFNFTNSGVVLQGTLLNQYHFLIAGQSNASGRGLVAGGETNDNPRIKMFGNDYILKQAYEPIDDYTNQIDIVSDDSALEVIEQMHSFGLKAAKDIHSSTNNSVTVIPCALGSTTFQNWMPELNTIDRNTLFGSAKYRQQQAAPNGLTAIWYFGHESNAAAFSDYRPIQETFFRRLRQYWTDCNVIQAQLAKNDDTDVNKKHNVTGNYQRITESGYSFNPLIVGNTVTKTDFTTTNWTDGVPDGFTLLNGDANNYIEQVDRGLRMYSDGSKSLALKLEGLSDSINYLIEVDLSEVTAGGIKTYDTGQISVLTDAEISRETHIINGSNFYIYRNTSGIVTDVVIRSLKIYEYVSGEIWEPLDKVHLVVSFDLPLRDGTHLNQDGVIEIGKRYALATRQHVFGDNVNGTGPRLIENAFTHPSGDKSKVKITFDKAINDGSTTNYNGQFRVYDDGVEMTINSVIRDVDGVSVLITMSATATGTVTVSYGDVAATGTGVWLTDVVQDLDNLPAPQFSEQEVI